MVAAYQEFVDFLTNQIPADSLVGFQPSEAAIAQVEDLIHREKTTGLTPEETTELDHYLQVEHIMRLAKAKARRFLSVG